MLFIQNAHLKPITSPDILSGCLLIGDDGKIAALGAGLTPPESAEILDAEGRLVTPGCVEAHCHIGLDNEAVGWEGKDYNEVTDPITPQMRAIDSIYPQDEAFGNALRGGVTTACTGPGSANVIGGAFAVIKLAGSRVDDMVVKFPAAMKCAFGENPRRVYGQGAKRAPATRMGVAALLRDFLTRAQKYQQDTDEGKAPAFDAKLEAMLPVMRGQIPLKAHAHRADDIFTAIRIAKEFGLKLTLDHCTDGAEIADALGAEGYPAFIGPSLGTKSKVELKNKSFATAGVLDKAGVDVSIITDAPVIPLQYLPLCAGLAAEAGLGEKAAWEAITIRPARALGVADRLGSLEVGKDADIVVWTANPLTTIGGHAWQTIVSGKTVYKD